MYVCMYVVTAIYNEHVQSCCFANLNLVTFCRSCWRRRRRCLKVMLHDTIRNDDVERNTS